MGPNSTHNLDMNILFFLHILIAYGLGSISSGTLLSQYFGAIDPRTQGSKSSGATNVLRTNGQWCAGLTLIFDALKTFMALLFFHTYTPLPWMIPAFVWPSYRPLSDLLRFQGVKVWSSLP